MEANRDLSHQVAQNAEWQQMELEYPEGLPNEQRMKDWIQTYVDSGLLEDYEALEVFSDWRRAYIEGQRE